MQHGQTIGCVTSCVVKQEELGQQPGLRKKNTPSINDAETCVGGASRSDAEKAGRTPCVTGRSNATDTCIGGASGCNTKKAGSVHSIGNRQSYETQEERRNFIRESFQLDSNKILNEDPKLKEEVIKLFLDNFKVLATHPSQYGETDVLEI